MKIVSLMLVLIIILLIGIALLIDLTPSLDVEDGELGFIIRIFTIPGLSMAATILLIHISDEGDRRE